MGNQLHYRADPPCPIYKELCGILRKTCGMADVLREALAPLRGGISVAFLCGSVAHGAERRASDIGVIVLGEASFEEAVKALHPCKESLRRQVNPRVYASKEFARKVQEQDTFLSRAVASPKLFLVEAEHELVKICSNAKAKRA